MQSIKFLVPTEHVPSFVEDISAWAAFTGTDPQLVQTGDPVQATNLESPISYSVAIDESFFVEYPSWRLFVEQ
ncbi:hypothetical protein QCE62_06775 [Caballeronia sp. LZ033]|uniref:hypothetical protein n=1 Tax=Caballeronia sp. LZ033 TaxID=3038566 RepID=UPI002855D64C|nr:hypothetical protein [Caballeronia sp. LZ033]MDR5813294.1 hypothetical protein [Caballeronia sp. LZ033]